MKLNISDTFNIELPADPSTMNTPRQVEEAFYSFVQPKLPASPKLLHYSPEMAELLGLSTEDVESDAFLQLVSGGAVYPNTKPFAMCYGGHQFGHWAGQLGDGRAINLMEITHKDQNWALQLKGAGPTPYSRSADGLAVLRSSIREHLCSEAMHHLGVPTTRSLSLCLSGDMVMRDVMYDGNPEYENGAIVCRVAPSFIRFGNFQIFASRNDFENVKKLADYTIQHLYPHLHTQENKYVAFFKEVAERTLDMVVHWQRVGFVHGVMNTDNMSILGLTIDFGPYGWLEGYDEGWTPNTTDRNMKRYRYGHQPQIALWNLLQLANALFPLNDNPKDFEDILHAYQENFGKAYFKMMANKLGIQDVKNMEVDFLKSLIENLQSTETDMTIFYRYLSQVSKNDSFTKLPEFLNKAFYDLETVTPEIENKWMDWFAQYVNILQKEGMDDVQRQSAMNKVNPKYVLRNYMAQLAIDASSTGDHSIIDELYQLLKNPYDEQPTQEKWFAKRPEWARHKVGCSMLSCSS